eukprot:TRINITY_DN1416_c0_g1_i14.p2 TRINITY_DN1416_c0_g1~~TRINITY_DN1416_c0_g1_i14.p2  ORF type:complete len:133 (+),score=10.95 TRINITY_DN1416_c0_g1_i14:365-763(+)
MIDDRELITTIYEILAYIKDPEFPNTLEELEVVKEEGISLLTNGHIKVVRIEWKPTVAHCSFAMQIGLSMICKLERDMPNFPSYKFQILIKEDSHKDKAAIDKQINDKERVAAARENKDLMAFIGNLIDQIC